LRHPIPREALDDRLGFIGTSGSGKTYNAGTAIEILLSQKARVVIIDPLGAWWGLRLLADGKKDSKFNVVIFGGEHADLPLNEQAGALLGETAATMSESCIIDLSKLPSRSAERRFMVAFLETIYRKAGGEPFHLVVDEADLFAPQKPQAGDEALLGHMDNIVRRGRMRGFIPWLISQRPAVLNKNVLSQVDGLLAFKLTASQDRDALDAWIEGQADKAQGKAIKDALPTFPIGEGIVWLPSHGILDRRPFPKKVTFDSSRKPKRGEKLKNRRLKPLNVGKLKEQLASVVEEAKANDPKALRKEVADLRAQLAKAAAAKPTSAPIDKSAEKKAAAEREEKARIRGKVDGYGEAMKDIASIFRELAPTMAKLMPLAASIDESGKRIDDWAKRTKEKQTELAKQVPAAAPPSAAPAAAPRAPVPPRQRPAAAANGADGGLTPMKQAILDASAWLEGTGQVEGSRMMVAFLADSSPKSSTFEKYVSQLRSAGLITSPRANVYCLTDEGRALANAGEAPLTHEAMMDKIGRKLTPGQFNIVSAAASAYPNTISRTDLATVSGFSETSSTFEKYLSQTKSLGLIEQPQPRVLQASERLFP
jgi:hypothetical protein